jgi:hypothetical protein
MLLIGVRALRLWCGAGEDSSGAGTSRARRALIVVGAILFLLIPNVITSVGPSWFPAEFLVLAAIFVMGVGTLPGRRAPRLRQM